MPRDGPGVFRCPWKMWHHERFGTDTGQITNIFVQVDLATSNGLHIKIDCLSVPHPPFTTSGGFESSAALASDQLT
jgi:hypothetical protein